MLAGTRSGLRTAAQANLPEPGSLDATLFSERVEYMGESYSHSVSAGHADDSCVDAVENPDDAEGIPVLDAANAPSTPVPGYSEADAASHKDQGDKEVAIRSRADEPSAKNRASHVTSIAAQASGGGSEHVAFHCRAASHPATTTL